MTRLRTFLLLVLVSIIVTASIQWSERLSDQALPVAGIQEKDEVDYSIEDFDLSLLDTTGVMQYHLHAAGMLHFKLSDQTRLQEPTVKLLRTGEEHWRINARSGLVSPRGVDVDLQGMVRVERLASRRLQPLNLTTDTLSINTRRNTISTEDAIHLQGDGIEVHATGLFADLDNEKIQLLAKVRVTYVPQR